MKNTFNLLFYAKSANKNGNLPIMVRITSRGEITQFRAPVEINPLLWDSKAGKAKGNTLEARNANMLLNQVRATIMDSYRTMILCNEIITPEKLRRAYLGLDKRKTNLLEIFKEHNEIRRPLVKHSLAQSTFNRYELVYERLEVYLKKERRMQDIPLADIDLNFIIGFESYLYSHYSISRNAVIKLIQVFKKIILLALEEGKISRNPFVNYSLKLEDTDPVYLTEDELKRILEKEFKLPKLQKVKDLFIFSCFTSLAFIDNQNLLKTDIVKGPDGKVWLKHRRTKTNIPQNIPLSDVPLKILEKYAPVCQDKYALPRSTHQRVNDYLKEIADICGIEKNITFHLARHTFATTVALNNDVPVETVKEIMGHTNIKTTLHYAKLLHKKVSRDMGNLHNVISSWEQMYR